MDSEQLLAEIREANLTYLMLAQNLIRKDRAEALYRLGLTEEAADLVEAFTAEIKRLRDSAGARGAPPPGSAGAGS